MSYRRALLRKEKRTKEKLAKRKDAPGKLLQERNKGYDDGKILASAVGSEAMYTLFGWKKDKIEKVFLKMGESAKDDRTVLKFVCDIYTEKMVANMKKDGILAKKVVAENPMEKARICERNETYIVCASMLFNALYTYFGLGFNNSRTGRLDKIMKFFENRFVDFNHNKYYEPTRYAQRIQDEIGINIM